jgi:hypothetical protein
LFDESEELLANKKHNFPLISCEDVWLSFREEQRQVFCWMQISGLYASLAAPSVRYRCQAELQLTRRRIYACFCYFTWNPQAAKS